MIVINISDMQMIKIQKKYMDKIYNENAQKELINSNKA